MKYDKEHPSHDEAKADLFSLAFPFFVLFSTFILYSMVLRPPFFSILPYATRMGRLRAGPTVVADTRFYSDVATDTHFNPDTASTKTG